MQVNQLIHETIFIYVLDFPVKPSLAAESHQQIKIVLKCRTLQLSQLWSSS